MGAPSALFILLILYILAPAIIYYDATNHKIGKIKGEKSLYNMSAGGWAGFTILLWIAGVPLYWIKRQELIEKAKNNPVSLNPYHRITVMGILVIISSCMAWLTSQHDPVAPNNISRNPHSLQSQ